MGWRGDSSQKLQVRGIREPSVVVPSPGRRRQCVEEWEFTVAVVLDDSCQCDGGETFVDSLLRLSRDFPKVCFHTFFLCVTICVRVREVRPPFFTQYFSYVPSLLGPPSDGRQECRPVYSCTRQCRPGPRYSCNDRSRPNTDSVFLYRLVS